MIHFDFENFSHMNTENSFRKKAMKPMKGHLIALLITLIILGFSFYIGLPALNLHMKSSVIYIVFHIAVFCGIDFLLTMKFTLLTKVMSGIAGALVVFMVVMTIAASPLFQADAYREQLTINEDANFIEDYETISLNQIPIIDYDAARQLGDKKMGQVSALGSQYVVSNQYTLISSADGLYRVSPLEYRDFIKWFQNRNTGVPGFIKVNVNDPSDVQLVELEEGMKYAPSAYFQQNLERHIRLSYPFDLLTDYSFEIDDENHPYWVVSTYVPEIGFFEGNSANGVIVVDPITGDMQKYGLDDVPSWVDRVQPSEFALSQLNNWGTYVNGFFNTVFGQKEMLQNTSGHNYLTINGETLVFTGMTSVGSDRSIVGFGLVNLKTKAAKFFKVNGADEASAMSSAEGEVQNLGYKSTFPIILNISGKPTYFVSLKDQEGLVKKYGFVSLENYSVVGIGGTVAEAQTAYIERLRQSGGSEDIDESSIKETTGTISSIRSAVVEGNTTYYFTLENDSHLYMAPVSVSTELPMSDVGHQIKITFIETGTNTIITNTFDNLTFNYTEETSK